MYGKGISKEGVLLDTAVDLDIIDKAGSWFSYGDQKLGQGRENVKKMLEDDPEFAKEIDAKVRAAFKKDTKAEDSSEEVEEDKQESLLEDKE